MHMIDVTDVELTAARAKDLKCKSCSW